jgi:hypothetical protein
MLKEVHLASISPGLTNCRRSWLAHYGGQRTHFCTSLSLSLSLPVAARFLEFVTHFRGPCASLWSLVIKNAQQSSLCSAINASAPSSVRLIPSSLGSSLLTIPFTPCQGLDESPSKGSSRPHSQSCPRDAIRRALRHWQAS